VSVAAQNAATEQEASRHCLPIWVLSPDRQPAAETAAGDCQVLGSRRARSEPRGQRHQDRLPESGLFPRRRGHRFGPDVRRA
jgi:hypothetical protein